jgi:uncharacterized protein YraI
MRPVRVSTVVWGVLLLLAAAAAFAITTLDVNVFTGASVAYLVVGVGVLLVIAAVVGAVARAVKPGPSAEPTTEDQPVD